MEKHKVKLVIDGKTELEKDIEFVEPEEIVKTFDMILDYAKMHKGSKIGMLKGLKGLR